MARQDASCSGAVGSPLRVPPGSRVGAVSRSMDRLDIFVTDNSGVIYTAAWEPDFADGWHGWWELNGGRAAPGAGRPAGNASRGVEMPSVVRAAMPGADAAAARPGTRQRGGDGDGHARLPARPGRDGSRADGGHHHARDWGATPPPRRSSRTGEASGAKDAVSVAGPLRGGRLSHTSGAAAPSGRACVPPGRRRIAPAPSAPAGGNQVMDHTWRL